MPDYLLFPWVSLGLFPLIIAAIVAWQTTSADRARQAGSLALIFSSLALIAARWDLEQRSTGELHLEPWRGGPLEGWFAVDSLNAIPLPLFSVLALGVVCLAPRRKVSPRWVSGVLVLTAATLATYAAANLLVLAVGWTLSVVPFLTGRFFTVPGEQEVPRLSRMIILGGIGCLLAGIALLVFPGGGGGIAFQLYGDSAVHSGSGGLLRPAFYLLMAAVFLRKGLIPVHSWIVAAFERGPLLPLALLVNGHLGVFLAARVAIPLLPDVGHEALPGVGDAALLTAAYAALLALVERQPRKLLALLYVSQASFLLVGLESCNVDGIAGALVLWQVVSIATTMLTAVYTGLEARIGGELDTRSYLGLAANAPRLAVFFLVGGLSLVGLPLTLGFCAEDLLLHGALARHPHLGVIVPVVTALNAFTVVRLWARLFLGQPGSQARGLADALPRERWALTAALLFLVIGGLLPGPLLRLPAAAAGRLVHPIASQSAPLHARHP